MRVLDLGGVCTVLALLVTLGLFGRDLLVFGLFGRDLFSKTLCTDNCNQLFVMSESQIF